MVREADGEDRPLHDDAVGIDPAAEQLRKAHIECEPGNAQIRALAILGIGNLDIGKNDMGARQQKERGRAIDLEIAPALLLDPRRDPVTHRIGGDEDIDDDQREHEERDQAGADLQEQFHSHQAQPAMRAELRNGSVTLGTLAFAHPRLM
ncbi:MAG: hypothetical protein WBB50_09155 [Methyloceanibacter sp.]